MANTITWSNLEDIFVKTGPVYLRGIVQTFFRESPFLGLIEQKGNVEKVSVSGPTVVERLRFGQNTTVGWRSTRSSVPIIEQSQLTTAAWTWGSLTGSVTFYDEDLHDNMGEAQLVNLVQVTLDQLADTIKIKLARTIIKGMSGEVLPPGEQSDAQILGIVDGITQGGPFPDPANPSTQLTPSSTNDPPQPPSYGGLTDFNLGYIEGAYPQTGHYAGGAYQTQCQWSAVTLNYSGLGFTSLDDALRALATRTTWGPVKPDFLLTDIQVWEKYEDLLQPNIRYNDVRVGDNAFQGLNVRGIPLIYDPYVGPVTSLPTGWYGAAEAANKHRVYAIRCADWKWFFDPQWDLQNGLEQTWRIPEDGFRRSRLLCIRSQLVCVNRTTQGLLWNVTL